LTLLLLGISVINLWLALDHALHAGHYRTLGVSYPPLLRALLALIWGLAWGAAGIALLRHTRHARRWILLVASNYGVFSVLWLSVFAESDAARTRVPFIAALTAICIALLAWVTSWKRLREPWRDTP
jgi:CHASE2 domain-containing sensor protein